CNKELERLQKEVKKFKKEADANLNGWKRALADLENFKKKVEEENKRLIQFANKDLILRILPILDNFKRAEKFVPEKERKNDWVLGIIHIKSQLENLLKDLDVEEISVLGKEFDPELCEAISKKGDRNIIKEVIETGYRMNGEVIRHAKVIVG
ncbi:nucleotide exchange factor GrpE, partial [bacterium (Candidatus Torokbacteria) CG_4_10_14_0_2_um_filter_35_8]